MNADTITAAFTTGTDIRVTLHDGSTITGSFVSVNSKGINVKVDGKTVSRGLGRIDSVERMDAPDMSADPFDGVGDNEALTTAALAAIFDTNAKALRVELRRVGLGVGKGSTYALTPATVRPLFGNIRDGLAARGA
jgi:hypothetical protein